MKRWLTVIHRILNRYEGSIEIFPGRKENEVHPSFSIGKYRTVDTGSGSRLEIGENVMFREFCGILVKPQAHLIIHANVFFNNYCSINCLGKIEIGENTIFGEGVKMYDHNHKHQYSASGILEIERKEFKIGQITIGRNCWIASNVTILNNVEIGDNVIVGAGCLIHRSIPSNSIVRLDQKLVSWMPPGK